VAPPLELVVVTRAAPNPKTKHKKQNNSFAISQLYNNMSLPCSRAPVYEPRPWALKVMGVALKI